MLLVVTSASLVVTSALLVVTKKMFRVSTQNDVPRQDALDVPVAALGHVAPLRGAALRGEPRQGAGSEALCY